jgi:hypothetical protein
MKDLLEYILKSITTQPDSVVVEESQEGDIDVYTITVHPDDMGRVIGKSGKVIHSIRTLARVAAVRSQKRIKIDLADSGQAPQDDQAPGETQDSQPEELSVEQAEEPTISETEESIVPEAEEPTAEENDEPQVEVETPSGEISPESLTGKPTE